MEQKIIYTGFNDPVSSGVNIHSAETRDLIVYQSYNGNISVVDKETGAHVLRLACRKTLSREQLEFIASDCQWCYVRPCEGRKTAGSGQRQKLRGV